MIVGDRWLARDKRNSDIGNELKDLDFGGDLWFEFELKQRLRQMKAEIREEQQHYEYEKNVQKANEEEEVPLRFTSDDVQSVRTGHLRKSNLGPDIGHYLDKKNLLDKYVEEGEEHEDLRLEGLLTMRQQREEEDKLAMAERLQQARRNLEREEDKLSEEDQVIQKEDLKFKAMDCTQPAYKQAVLPLEARDCAEDVPILGTRNVSAYILQDGDYFRQEAMFCSEVQTELSNFCGTYDHQTFFPQMSSVNSRVIVNDHTCRTWHDTRQYKDPKDNYHPLGGMGEINDIKFMSRGSVNPSTSQVHCSGETVKVKVKGKGEKMDVPEVVTAAFTKVTLDRMQIMVDQDGKVYNKGLGLTLNCPYAKGWCVTGKGTFVWATTAPRKKCNTYMTREVKGEIRTSAEGDVFFSKSAMIHLALREPTIRCGMRVRTTDYPKIMFVEQKDIPDNPMGRKIIRKLPTNELSAIVYSNLKSEFVYDRATDYAYRMFQDKMKAECRKKRMEEKAAFAAQAAEQRVFADGESTSLGHDWFGTASGEAWYQYRCFPYNVTFRTTGECYTALPVNLAPLDRERFINRRIRHGDFSTKLNETEFIEANKHLHSLQFWIEPRTRRLLTEAPKIPCSRLFPSLWKAASENWVSFSPYPKRAVAPKTISVADNTARFSPELPESYNFAEGGIYNAEQVADLDKFTRIADMRRDFITRFTAGQLRRPVDNGEYTPANFFPSLEGIDFDVMKSFWQFINDYGGLCSLIICIYLGWQLLYFFLNWVFKSYIIKRNDGDLFEHLASMFSTTAFHVLSQRWPQKKGGGFKGVPRRRRGSRRRSGSSGSSRLGIRLRRMGSRRGSSGSSTGRENRRRSRVLETGRRGSDPILSASAPDKSHWVDTWQWGASRQEREGGNRTAEEETTPFITERRPYMDSFTNGPPFTHGPPAAGTRSFVNQLPNPSPPPSYLSRRSPIFGTAAYSGGGLAYSSDVEGTGARRPGLWASRERPLSFLHLRNPFRSATAPAPADQTSQGGTPAARAASGSPLATGRDGVAHVAWTARGADLPADAAAPAMRPDRVVEEAGKPVVPRADTPAVQTHSAVRRQKSKDAPQQPDANPPKTDDTGPIELDRHLAANKDVGAAATPGFEWRPTPSVRPKLSRAELKRELMELEKSEDPHLGQ